MIHGVYSNISSFKKVYFGKGLNIIVAQRKQDSDQKQTINSRGKSTLISIINFCLGSDANSSGLLIDELMGWDFILDITVLKNRVQVTRQVRDNNKFYVEGNPDNWPFKLEYDKESNKYFLPLKKWKKLLGVAFFNISPSTSLSVRSLISYFVRSGSEAYANPLKFIPQHSNNIAHIYNTFLVGLNSEYASEWCEIDKQEKALKALKDAIKAGIHETLGELEAKKVELEEEVDKNRKILLDFKVHEKYKDIQNEANQLTDELHRLSNQNIIQSQILQNYQSAITEETPPDQRKLIAIYEEIGVIFPEAVKHTLTEACSFHEQIIKNRAIFLKAEILKIQGEISHTEQLIQSRNEERSVCMTILRTHGAFEEYNCLQEDQTKTQHKLEKILNKIEDFRDNSKKSKNIKSKKLELDTVATIDYEEKRDYWEKAIRLFNEFAKSLYGVPGEFVIDISEKGYCFKVDIPGGRGGGIGKMKIFCYDLMTICMQKLLERDIDFLIHDSIIYEGVDERQVAHAIEQAASKAKEFDFQYIMTINSDMIPYKDFSKEFKFDDFVKLRLSDEDEESGLLGIRF